MADYDHSLLGQQDFDLVGPRIDFAPQTDKGGTLLQGLKGTVIFIVTCHDLGGMRNGFEYI
jgi:hypothetical protein